MKKIITYDNPRFFWDDVSPYLKEEEAKNSLCLGLAYRFQSNSGDCMYQSALFEDDTLAGALVLSRHRTNQNLLPTPVPNIEAASTLLDVFLKEKRSMTGVVGEKRTANIYRDLLEERGMRTKVNMVQGIYRCKKVKMPDLENNLTFRMAELDDVEEIGKWIKEFHHEAVPHDPPVDGKEIALGKIEQSMIYVVEKDGDLVSMAAWSRNIETSCSVNMVYTPKQLRKKGFASAVTAKLTQHLIGNGKRETNLYTDMSNSTSNKIYMDIGYEFVCDSIHYGIS